MSELTHVEFKELIAGHKDYLVIDVREEFEIENNELSSGVYLNINESNILNIPLFMIKSSIDLIDPNKHIIVVCRSGIRSKAVVEFLIHEGYKYVFNLKQGVLNFN